MNGYSDASAIGTSAIVNGHSGEDPTDRRSAVTRGGAAVRDCAGWHIVQLGTCPIPPPTPHTPHTPLAPAPCPVLVEEGRGREGEGERERGCSLSICVCASVCAVGWTMRLLAGALALCATFQGAQAQCADLDSSGQVGVEVRAAPFLAPHTIPPRNRAWEEDRRRIRFRGQSRAWRCWLSVDV